MKEFLVTQIPLEKIWKDNLYLNSIRKNYLTKDDLTKILQSNYVQFVVADIGKNLDWIEFTKCFEFWKENVKDNIADGYEELLLENYDNNFFFLVSEWSCADEIPLILVEKYH